MLGANAVLMDAYDTDQIVAGRVGGEQAGWGALRAVQV